MGQGWHEAQAFVLLRQTTRAEHSKDGVHGSISQKETLFYLFTPTDKQW